MTEKKEQLVQMSRLARALLAKRKTETNARYLEQRAPAVLDLLRKEKTVGYISKKLRMRPMTVKKIAEMNGTK